jgi:hypothetical protein
LNGHIIKEAGADDRKGKRNRKEREVEREIVKEAIIQYLMLKPTITINT